MKRTKPTIETALESEAVTALKKRVAELEAQLNGAVNLLRAHRNQLTKLAGSITTALGE